jgi:hypothetical protein
MDNDVLYKIVVYAKRKTLRNILSFKSSKGIEDHEVQLVKRCNSRINRMCLPSICRLFEKIKELGRDDLLVDMMLYISPLKRRRLLIHCIKTQNYSFEKHLEGHCNFYATEKFWIGSDDVEMQCRELTKRAFW